MGKVDLFVMDIRDFRGDPEEVLAQIAPCYREKHRTHKIEKDALQELVSGWMLRKYLGIERDDQLGYNKFGKPYLTRGDGFFNLSHSGDYVLLGIADCELGVDVEVIRPFHEAAAKKVFSTEQNRELFHLQGEKRDERFTQMWTVCEAMLKLKGTGFGEEWDKEKAPLEKCSVFTDKFDVCFFSCATEEKADISVHFC